MQSEPQPIVNFKLRKYTKGATSYTYKEIDLSGNNLVDFDWYITTGFYSAPMTVRIIDYTWELGEIINIHQFKKGDYMKLLFQIGYSEPLWYTLEGRPEPSMSSWFEGTVSLFSPTFSENGVSIELQVFQLSLEKVLNHVNRTYQVPDNITNLRDAYLDIASTFNIDISSPRGKDLVDVDTTDFTEGDRKLKLPPKKAGVSGLDYLAEIYRVYPVTIGGAATYVRFNSLGRNGGGYFEILSDRNLGKIKRVYRYNGDDSRIISFNLELNAFKIDLNSESFSYLSYDNKLGKTASQFSTRFESNDPKSSPLFLASSVIANRIVKVESNYLKDLTRGNMVILCDPNIFICDYVQVEMYKKLDGKLLLSIVVLVTGVRHYIEDGRLYTSIDFSRSDIGPVLGEKTVFEIPDIVSEIPKGLDQLETQLRLGFSGRKYESEFGPHS